MSLNSGGQKVKINLSIVIPVYNEQERIQTTFRAVDDFVARESQNYNLEIIFVNDGSQDDTPVLIEQYIKNKVGVARLISYDDNKGKGYAVRQGMLKSTGDYCLMIDADMSTSFDELNLSYPLIMRGEPIIIGSRKGQTAVLIKKQPWYRQKMGEIYAGLARVVTGLKIKDFGCGFKIFSRAAIADIFSRTFINGWIFDTEVLFFAKKFGYRVNEIGVRWINDDDSRVNAGREAIKSLWDLGRIYWAHRDLDQKQTKLSEGGFNKRKEYLSLLLIIILAALAYLPYLLYPNFSLLDDPWYLNQAHKLSLFDWRGMVMAHSGRLIPFTLFFYVALYKLANFTAVGFIYLRFLELVIILFLSYYLIKSMSSVARAIWGTIFILSSSAIITNFYELETQDHLTVLLLLPFTIVYHKILKFIEFGEKKVWLYWLLSAFFLLLSFLTKETNIFLVVVFALLLGYDFAVRSGRGVKLLNFSYLLVSLVWLLIYYLNSKLTGAVAGDYNLGNLIGTSFGYLKILNFNILLVVFAFLGIIINLRKEGINFLMDKQRVVFLILLSIASFAIYLPWGSVADRYLAVPVVFFYILLFSKIDFSQNKKFWVGLLALVLAGNLYLSTFHVIRFYGSRVADAKLLDYLDANSSDYDQVCTSLSPQSVEGILELNIWLNEIKQSGKKICTLTKLDNNYYIAIKSLLDKADITYGENVRVNDRTIVIVPNFTGVVFSPFDDKYEFISEQNLEYKIYNLHPTRGFETKTFGWIIGRVELNTNYEKNNNPAK